MGDLTTMCGGGSEPTLVPGELRGYRFWKLGYHGQLHAIAWPEVWPLEREGLIARCMAPKMGCGCGLCKEALFRGSTPHDVPLSSCNCGIYGWYSPDDTRRSIGHIEGVVAASGRTLLGDYGFRTERARIVAVCTEVIASRGLLFTDPIGDVIDRLVDRLDAAGIPHFVTRDAMIEAFPPDDVSGLLGRDTRARFDEYFVGGMNTYTYTRAEMPTRIFDRSSSAVDRLVTRTADERMRNALEEKKARGTGPTRRAREWY